MRKPASFYFFKRKPIVPTCRDRYELWRGVTDLLGFKAHEGLRVEWMVFYYTTGEGECRSHCQTLWHLKEDFSQMVQAL